MNNDYFARYPYNPVRLKLELLSCGIKIDSEVEEQFGKEIKRPVSIRAGAGGAGIDLILTPDIWVGPQSYESYVKNTPFSLAIEEGRYVIKKRGETIFETRPVPEPMFYDKTTSDGVPLGQIGRIQADFIAIAPIEDCEFWDLGVQCKFCAMGALRGKNTRPRKTLQQMLEFIDEAVHWGYDHMILNAGTYPRPDRGAVEQAELVKAIKDNFGIHVRISMCPPDETSYVDLLKEAGVDVIGHNLEVWSPEAQRFVTPGKVNEIGLDHYLKTFEYEVKLFGWSKVVSTLIVGLEDPKSTLEGAEKLASMGVLPLLFCLRPLRGSYYANSAPPDAETLIEVYRGYREIVNKYHLDTGCARCGRLRLDTKVGGYRYPSGGFLPPV